MKKWSITLLAAFVITAQAETISLPCTEYVAATGESLSCQAIPNIQIERADFEAKKAAHAQGPATTANSPWAKASERPPEEQPQQVPKAEDCKMPIWMRPEGCPKS